MPHQNRNKMKKLFRKVWLAMLAITAVITGSCCSNKTTSGTNDNPNQANNEAPAKPSKSELKKRIEAIREQVARRESACVYGSPEMMQRYGQETQRLRHEADSLQYILDHYNEIK